MHPRFALDTSLVAELENTLRIPQEIGQKSLDFVISPLLVKITPISDPSLWILDPTRQINMAYMPLRLRRFALANLAFALSISFGDSCDIGMMYGLRQIIAHCYYRKGMAIQ